MWKFGKVFVKVMVALVWYVTVAFWPLIKWVVAANCFLQALRMFHHWHNPDAYPVMTFGVSFMVLTGLMWFVSHYKPNLHNGKGR